jgi:hypothetical protein
VPETYPGIGSQLTIKQMRMIRITENIRISHLPNSKHIIHLFANRITW